MDANPQTPGYARSEECYALMHRLGYDDAWEGPWSRSDYTRYIRELLDSDRAPAPGARVLATGCGDGKITCFLAAQGYVVKGVDIAPTAIKIAREKARKQDLEIEHVVGDVTRLDEPDETYDCVIDTKVHHCLSEPRDRAAHLREAFRVLRPGGLMLFTASLFGDDDEETPEPTCMLEIDGRQYEQPNLDRFYFRDATVDEYVSELQAAGFRLDFQEERDTMFVAYAVRP